MSDESRRGTTWIVVAVVLAVSWIAGAVVMSGGFVESSKGQRTMEVVEDGVPGGEELGRVGSV